VVDNVKGLVLPELFTIIQKDSEKYFGQKDCVRIYGIDYKEGWKILVLN
jgi:hypothetical protein